VCQSTEIAAAAARAAIRRALPPELRSHCVACRRAMNIKGDAFTCPACGTQAKTHSSHSYRRDIERPACSDCGRPKALASKKRGRRRFFCGYCYGERKRLRRNSEALAELLRRIDAALPGCLPPDAREDASQAAALAVLKGSLSPRAVTPRTLAPFARAALGMTQDRFRFISLSQPTEDGREFGDTLAA
jgi:predicted RNA-binding Zn-ribbon protein involved in translation (DUF1610 family)